MPEKKDKQGTIVEAPQEIREVVKTKYLTIYTDMGWAFYERGLGDHRVSVELRHPCSTSPDDEREIIRSKEERNRADFDNAVQSAISFMEMEKVSPHFTENQIQVSVHNFVLAVADGAKDRITNSLRYQPQRYPSHKY